MKFLCSILILAGVFALNDAFPSDDDQMRLANDKMIMEDLKLMVANRDASSSVQCSQDYLAGLSECLETYNNGLKACESAAKSAIDALNNNAKEQINEYTTKIASECSENKCPASESPADDLDCLEQESSKYSKNLSEISVQCSTIRVSLLKSIEDAQGIKDVCDQEKYSDYSSASQKVEDTFKKCVQS